MAQVRSRRRRKVKDASSALYTIAGAVVLASVVGFGMWFVACYRSTDASRATKAAARAVHRSPELPGSGNEPARRVYPLSVIPGGAYSPKELTVARALDPVVDRHYADFGASTVVSPADRDLFMFVSYRKSDRIYWTKTRHRIPKGEMLLNAGGNLARARCGNRLSPVAQKPTSGGDEPTEDVLNSPEIPSSPWVPTVEAPWAPGADLYIPALPISIDGTAAAPPFPEPAKNVVSGASPGSEAMVPINTHPGGTPVIWGSPAYVPTGANTVGATNPASGSPTSGTSSSGSGTPSSAAPVVAAAGPSVPEPATGGICLCASLIAGLLIRRARRTSPR
jgi:hypothetical protein